MICFVSVINSIESVILPLAIGLDCVLIFFLILHIFIGIIVVNNNFEYLIRDQEDLNNKSAISYPNTAWP